MDERELERLGGGPHRRRGTVRKRLRRRHARRTGGAPAPSWVPSGRRAPGRHGAHRRLGQAGRRGPGPLPKRRAPSTGDRRRRPPSIPAACGVPPMASEFPSGSCRSRAHRVFLPW